MRQVPKWGLTGLWLLTSLCQVTAQSQLLVGPNVLVSDDDSGPHLEPTIAADSSEERSNTLLGAAFVHQGGGNRTIAKVYRSIDGGSTWTDSAVPLVQQAEDSGDVQTAFDSHGTAYFLALFDPFRSFVPQARRGGYFFRSIDGGATWGTPIWFGWDDHPQLLVDSTTGEYADRIYIWCERGLYRSQDGGITFIGPVIPPRPEPGYTNSNSQNPLVLSDGSLFLPRDEWSENEEDSTSSTQRQGIAFSISRDGGVSMGPLRHIEDQVIRGKNRHLGDMEAGSIWNESPPKFAIDLKSAEYNDRIYVVWDDVRFGYSRILFAYSTDHGLHWTRPIKVDADVPTESLQYQPAIAVNRHGIVGVQWFDTRSFSDARSYNLYFAVSRDGGKTFSKAVKVSTASSVNSAIGNLRAGVRYLNSAYDFSFDIGRWPTAGEYMGLTADNAGTFHPFWSDSRSGSYQIYTANVSLDSREDNTSARKQLSETDVTQLVILHFDPAHYDPNSKEFVFPTRIYNSSRLTVCGPLRVEIKTISGSIQDPFVNSSNGKTGAGAVFEYGLALRDIKCLEPGGITEPLNWRVRYVDWSPGGFSLDLRAIGSVGQEPSLNMR